jgi:CubicO group peptidase (beta-lactamase class C family)
LQGAFDRLNAIIERKIQALNYPGLAIGITNRDRLLFLGHYGLANRDAQTRVTPETRFQIGSISKAFTSIALLQLQQQGLLQIDDPVTKFLPWFEVRSGYSPITLRHLLSHTAGIITGSDETSAGITETWNLRHTHATARPGEMFHYSNSGYKVLGVVLETVLQQPIAQILKTRLLDPLGMRDSHAAITQAIRPQLAVGYEGAFDDRPHLRGGPLAPAPWLESDTADGAICATAEDMCCFLRTLLNRGKNLISPASFEQFAQPQIATEDGLHGESYGLGIFIQNLSGHHILGHSGGMVGYLAHLLADLNAGLGIIALTNSPYSPQAIVHLAREWLVAILEGAEILETSPDDPYRVENLDDYVGRYHCGEKTFTLISNNEHLHLEFAGDSVCLEPIAPDAFLVPHPFFALFALHFERGIKGNGKDQITTALHGSDMYLREGMSEPPEIEIPPDWRAYPGHYRSYNPWLSNFRVVLRRGQLLLIEPQGMEEPLYLLGAGLFRVGKEPRSPEFLRFEAVIDGKAQFANYSGGAYCRTFTP